VSSPYTLVALVGEAIRAGDLVGLYRTAIGDVGARPYRDGDKAAYGFAARAFRPGENILLPDDLVTQLSTTLPEPPA
jgi:hypothetical protein